jgi:hypothetical protein
MFRSNSMKQRTRTFPPVKREQPEDPKPQQTLTRKEFYAMLKQIKGRSK